MLEALKQEVLEANLALEAQGVVRFTWGNVSALDPALGLFVIKPSGVPYETMKAEDMVVMDLEGKRVEGRCKPSSDTETHRALYRAWPWLRAVVHTHSLHATAFAQAGKPIPALGTTHADHFFGDIPVTRPMTATEIAGDYEWETGQVIIQSVPDPQNVPAVLVWQHGPFAWGPTAMDAVVNAVVLEETAHMAVVSAAINPAVSRMDKALLDKHYLRKHGANAYYGQ